MKLIMTPTSPFVRKIRIMLLEKNILCEQVVDMPRDPNTRVPEYNPLGKIPVLVLDDGDCIYDSRVIAEYLELLKPWPRLIPEDPNARLDVLRWQALTDGICEAASLIFLESLRPRELQSPDWVQRQQGKILRGLKNVNDLLNGKTWCVEDTFTLADIGVACALGFIDFRLPELNWREGNNALSKMAERLYNRPSVQETVPPKPV